MKYYTVFAAGEQTAHQFQALGYEISGMSVTFMLPNGTRRTFTAVIRFDEAEVLVPEKKEK